MPEGDRAAVDVDAILVDAEHPHRVQGHRGERLVDLEEVDVVDAEPRLLERELGGLGRSAREVSEVVRDSGLREDRGEPLAIIGLCPLLGGQHERSGAVVDAGGVARGVGSALGDRLELGQRLERRLGARALVALDGRLALLGGHRHGGDLLREPALVGGLHGELMAAQREAIQIGAGHLELLGDLRRLRGHHLAREGVGEAVVGHRVNRVDVAHAEAEARLGQQIGRPRHRLHAARDGELEVACAHSLVDQADGPQARGTDLVDRLGGDLLGNPRLDLGLPGRDLALTRLQHLAHHHVLDLVGLDLGALERGLDRRRRRARSRRRSTGLRRACQTVCGLH